MSLVYLHDAENLDKAVVDMVDPSSVVPGKVLALAYEQILSPVATRFGKDMALFYDVVRRVIVNPEFKEVEQRYRDFLEETIQKVPPERLQLPPEQILGPVLEAKRFEPNGSPISELFSELLSKAFDRDRVGEAHPAFRNIIGQLASDEARILRLYKSPFFWQFTNYRGSGPLYVLDAETIEVAHRNELPFYRDHLISLGILSPEPPSSEPATRQIGSCIIGGYTFPAPGSFGQAFIKAVVPAFEMKLG